MADECKTIMTRGAKWELLRMHRGSTKVTKSYCLDVLELFFFLNTPLSSLQTKDTEIISLFQEYRKLLVVCKTHFQDFAFKCSVLFARMTTSLKAFLSFLCVHYIQTERKPYVIMYRICVSYFWSLIRDGCSRTGLCCLPDHFKCYPPTNQLLSFSF